MLHAGAGNSDLKYGYLGPDENLEKLIEADAKLLEERGLTHDQVARAIEELFAWENFEEFKGAPIFPLEFIHSPQCPWQDFAAVSPFDLSKKVTEIVVVNRAKIDEFFKLLEERGESNPWEPNKQAKITSLKPLPFSRRSTHIVWRLIALRYIIPPDNIAYTRNVSCHCLYTTIIK